MAKKETHNYFEMMENLVGYSCNAANNLHDTLTDFKPENVLETMQALHTIEHTADVEKHSMMSKLVKEFITPIEREDINRLGCEIDEVTDAIEDVLMRIYMYNVRSIPADALEFSEIIVKCCDALRIALQEFHNFKKSTTIHDLIVEINRLEEVGDRLYTKAVHNLFANCQNAIEVMAWNEVYERMERCCDACEHTANVIESVIMQNS